MSHKNYFFFILSPGLFIDPWIKMIMVPLSTLLSRPSFQAKYLLHFLCYYSPLLDPILLYKLEDGMVFFFIPSFSVSHF